MAGMAAMRCKLHRFIGLGQYKILGIVSLVRELCDGRRDSHGNGCVSLRARDKRRERCSKRL